MLQLSFHFSSGFKEILGVSKTHLFSDVATVFLVSVYKGKTFFLCNVVSVTFMINGGTLIARLSGLFVGTTRNLCFINHSEKTPTINVIFAVGPQSLSFSQYERQNSKQDIFSSNLSSELLIDNTNRNNIFAKVL